MENDEIYQKGLNETHMFLAEVTFEEFLDLGKGYPDDFYCVFVNQRTGALEAAVPGRFSINNDRSNIYGLVDSEYYVPMQNIGLRYPLALEAGKKVFHIIMDGNHHIIESREIGNEEQMSLNDFVDKGKSKVIFFKHTPRKTD